MPADSLAQNCIRAVNHVSLTVTDLDRSVRFYEDTFGFRTVMRQVGDPDYLSPITGYPNVGILQAQLEMVGGVRLELFQYTNPVGQPHDPETYHPLSTHICFEVDQLAAFHDRLKAAGVYVRSEPVVVSAGANKGGLCFYMRDPDGYTLEIFQRPAQR